MSKQWPRVKLREVLTPVQRDNVPTAGTLYRQIGVRLWGEGAYERESIDGSQTKYAKLFQAKTGDIIVNKIWARNGSVAVVDASLDGTWGSVEFPLFESDQKVLNPRWMHWVTKAPWFWQACDEQAQGTSGKNRIKPEQFLGIEIPLPPTDEQHRLVARIDEIASRITQAERLRDSVVLEQKALCCSLIANDPSTKFLAVTDVVRQRALDVIVQPDQSYQFAGVYSFGKGVFKGQIKSGVEFAYPKLARVKTGDFIYPKLMAWEGALGVVPPECDGCVVSPEFPVFEIDENKVLPDVFDVYFRDPRTWESLQSGSTGTNARRRRFNPADFLKLLVPVPSKETQRKLSDVRRLQSQFTATQADITGEALLASVLNELLA